MREKEDIKSWYNTYATKQKRTGLNLRHYSIINQLINYGLKKNSNVLEIGIGTLTSLLHSYLSKGKIVATDISDVSVEMAKKEINSKRATFYVTDMKQFTLDEKFDFIVLPDVLEHIPMEDHKELFKVLSNLLKNTGVIFIHIPHPKVINYIRKNTPELLQVIDQSIPSNFLLENAYAADLLLVDYKSYSLFKNENDYAAIAFRKNVELEFTNRSQKTIILHKLKARIKYFLAKI
ncbi:MAG: class I SAM-dependent methyltransferase [Flavobacteriaceae bacterium]